MTNRGGGIYNSGGLITVTNGTVTENSSGNHGGGIYNSGTLALTNVEITRNSTSVSPSGLINGVHGGRIYNTGSGSLILKQASAELKF